MKVVKILDPGGNELKNAAGPLKANTDYELTLAPAGTATGATDIKIEVATGADYQVKKKADAAAAFASSALAPVANGKSEVTLRVKTTTDVVLNATPLQGATPGTVTPLAWRGIAKFSVDQKTGPLTARTVYPDALIVTALTNDDPPLPAANQNVKVRVVGNRDARLFLKEGDGRTREVTTATDAAGKAVVSIETGKDLEVEFLVIPLDKDGNEIHVGEQAVELTGLRTFDTFHSRRLFTEVFTGATFTNDYDEEGESTGFNQAGPLIRVTFDTLWYNQKLPRGRGLIQGSLLHSGVDMEVSSFPFGDEEETGEEPEAEGEVPPSDPPENAPKGLENAFSGTLFAVWQPDRWASYTPTSLRDGIPTDALRFGVFTKIGVTTRPQAKAGNGDTSFHRMQLGLRFTHHQTEATTAGSEQDNIVPIRFVEVSFGRFEEFAGEREANRMVLDAGFRLPGAGSNAIPFYAGIHMNFGRGPDDIRVFAGFLFKINELATMFQRGGVSP